MLNNLMESQKAFDEKLMWDMVNNPPAGLTPSPDSLSPADKQNINPNQISIGMIFIIILVHQGMAPIENDMQQLADDQKLQDALDSDDIDLASIISQMEQGSGPNGIPNVSQFIQELKQFFGQAFGKMTQEVVTDSHGNKETIYVPVSGSNSDFAKFIAMLQSKYGADWFKNPAFQTIENLVKNLETTAPAGGGGYTWAQLMEGQNDQDFSAALNQAAINYYQANNPGTTPAGPNYFNDMYTAASAVQAALQGMGSQNIAQLQVWSANIQSFTQTGQNATSGFNSAINTMIRNEIAG